MIEINSDLNDIYLIKIIKNKYIFYIERILIRSLFEFKK